MHFRTIKFEITRYFSSQFIKTGDSNKTAALDKKMTNQYKKPKSVS